MIYVFFHSESDKDDVASKISLSACPVCGCLEACPKTITNIYEVHKEWPNEAVLQRPNLLFLRVFSTYIGEVTRLSVHDITEPRERLQ